MDSPTETPRWQLLAAALLIAAAFWGYLPATGSVFYSGDMARLYLPQQTLLASALATGQLPWWTSLMGAGYPLLAEGETGALYPINLLLHALLAPDVVITVSVLLHLLLAGLGTAWLARCLGISRAGAFLSGLVFALGGFNIAHTSHVSILSVTAWLPWLLVMVHRSVLATDLRDRLCYAVGLGMVVALQFLAGHGQMSLLVLLPALFWAAGLIIHARGRQGTARKLILPGLCVLLGTALAFPQLLATLELADLSQRAGGLESSFFTSYSFHPLMTATFLSPFLLGNPYPGGTIELMPYVGLLPLALSSIAITRGRGPARWWLAGLGVLGLLMAFGRWNPVYVLLERLPPFNLFRVPARYLLWTSLALALLGALGLDTLFKRNPPSHRGAPFAGGCIALAIAAAAVSIHAPNADALVAAWRWLPWVHVLAVVLWLLGTRSQPRAVAFWLAIVILCADLYSYGGVLRMTYSQSWPLRQVRAIPDILDMLPSDSAPYRIWTKEAILPAMSVQRASLYPNIAATYGVAGANVYSPLVPRTYGEYVRQLDAGRLNKLNVRYYFIPQLLPVDEASELYDVLDPFSALTYGTEYAIDVPDVVEVQVESYVSHAAELPNGTLAATLSLSTSPGTTQEFPIRVGIETSEWAIEREDVAMNAQHDMAPVASSFPARSSYRNVAHAGHTYLARWTLPSPARIVGLQVRPELPEAYIRIERIRFLTAGGDEILASELLGLGDHRIAYRTEDVLVYENLDVWPRAYTVPLADTKSAEPGIELRDGLERGTLGRVDIENYQDLLIELHARVDVPSLLVLADMDYPGWEAWVDGQPVAIYPVDGLFRGITLGPGDHTVRFEYRP